MQDSVVRRGLLGELIRACPVDEYVPRPMSDTLDPMTTEELARVGSLIRELHDVCESFVLNRPRRGTW
jgi:hypothetical protein